MNKDNESTPVLHRQLFTSICRALHISLPKSKGAQKPLDMDALDDWTPEFFSAQSRSRKVKGGIYSELYRRFKRSHLEGKPEEAEFARSEGLVLSQMINESSQKLQDRFSYLQSDPQLKRVGSDPNSTTTKE